jgi:heme-degrading monooxygenase HmoA
MNINKMGAFLVGVLAFSTACGAVDVVNHEAVLNAPFDGPGWDAKGKKPRDATPRRVVVAGTHLMLPNKLAAHRSFWNSMTSIRKALKDQPGFIGYATRTATDLSEDWTMSVWENEEAMYDYVTGQAHADAINALEPYATGGWVTHFEVDVSELPISIDDVIARIRESGRKAYPNVSDEPR